MKRKSQHGVPNGAATKKRPGSRLNPANAISDEDKAEKTIALFAEKLFDGPVKDGYRDSYAASEPCVFQVYLSFTD